MGEIVLVRHAQAGFGQTNYDELSPLGQQQASALGQWWQKTAAFSHDTCVWTGTLCRQQQTAALALSATALQTHIDSGLDEFDFSDILRQYRPDFATPEHIASWLATQPQPYQAFQRVFTAACEQWVQGTHDHCYQEPWAQFQQRVTLSLNKMLAHSCRHHLVFSSGGVIALIMAHALQLPPERSLSLNAVLWNTSISRLLYTQHQLSLLEFNSIAHLEVLGDRRWRSHR